MVKKVLKILLVLLIIAGLIALGFYLWNLFKKKVKPNLIEDRIVSEAVARRAAKASIERNPVWEGAQLGEYYTYFDLDNVTSAYMYSVSRYGRKVGYVTISASTRFIPEVETSNETYLPSQKLHKIASDKAMFNNRSANDIKTELIYAGSIKYFGKLTIRNGDETAVEYYFLNPKEPEETDLDTITGHFNTYKESRVAGSGEVWSEFID